MIINKRERLRSVQEQQPLQLPNNRSHRTGIPKAPVASDTTAAEANSKPHAKSPPPHKSKSRPRHHPLQFHLRTSTHRHNHTSHCGYATSIFPLKQPITLDRKAKTQLCGTVGQIPLRTKNIYFDQTRTALCTQPAIITLLPRTPQRQQKHKTGCGKINNAVPGKLRFSSDITGRCTTRNC